MWIHFAIIYRYKLFYNFMLILYQKDLTKISQRLENTSQLFLTQTAMISQSF